MHTPNIIHRFHSLTPLHSITQTQLTFILPFHFNSSTQSIYKFENSTTTIISPPLQISSLPLRIHHFTPILIYFIHHINTKKYLQFVSTISTQPMKYNIIHHQNTHFQRYRALFSTIFHSIFSFIHTNRFISLYSFQ